MNADRCWISNWSCWRVCALAVFCWRIIKEKFADIEFKYLSCHEKNQIGFRHVWWIDGKCCLLRTRSGEKQNQCYLREITYSNGNGEVLLLLYQVTFFRVTENRGSFSNVRFNQLFTQVEIASIQSRCSQLTSNSVVDDRVVIKPKTWQLQINRHHNILGVYCFVDQLWLCSAGQAHRAFLPWDISTSCSDLD